MYYYNTLTEEDYTHIQLKSMITKYILILSLECKGSIRGIKSAIEKLLKVKISTGTIHNILEEAANRAKSFNESIPLYNVEVGASDEIFQAGMPVLVGVEPTSTYVYLMESSDKRDSIAWGMAYYEKFEKQDLKNIQVSVTDGGTGMKKGIRDVFPNIEEQYDIFHLERKFSQALSNYENKTYAAIKIEYKLKDEHTKKNTKETEMKYKEASVVASNKINKYDKLNILFTWVKELFEFTGYSHPIRIDLMNFIVSEFDNLGVNNKYIKGAITTLKSNILGLLSFVKRAESLMLDLSNKENINIDILFKFWSIKGLHESSRKYKEINDALKVELNNDYQIIKNRTIQLFKTIVRASSIVENINSQLRPYLFLKRTLKGNFLHLLQYYLNTRKYSYSRINERIGKSPLELLTGKAHSDWVELLGY